jgi:hypothetical protein
MSTTPQATPAGKTRPPVIRTIHSRERTGGSALRVVASLVISLMTNIVPFLLFLLFSLFTFGKAAGQNEDPQQVQETQVEEQDNKADLTDPDIGINPDVPLNYNVDRIEEVSVPGPVDPSQSVGIPGAPPDAPMANVPPPPGFASAQGLGAGVDSADPGKASMFGSPGGYGGLMMPGGFGGRSGSTRVKMAMEGGGNAASEAAVAKGLRFLARHQSPDGHWSLDQYQLVCNPAAPKDGQRINSNCSGQGMKNDIAGTAFGLLPFLGAGKTHKPGPPEGKEEINYQKTVEAALRYLLNKQDREGDFGGGMYAHGLATIAVCEAYGLTSDPQLKPHAQGAVDFIVKAQDPASGGWRYAPRQGGDTSVVGWQVMALKSAQMSGLNVPSSTLKGAEKWLDSCMTSDKGGYGYTGPQETPTMSAVGLLCRMYLGWSPKNPGLINGVARIKNYPPGSMNSMYYYYYATQVMHHMGGDNFEFWNPKMRDLLIKGQDQGKDSKRPYQDGSWDAKTDGHGSVGGRIMITSLSLLTLEVYYRHLPLYRREMGVSKEAAETK